MASKKFEKGSEEWQFFNDYYKFRQQFYEADNDGNGAFYPGDDEKSYVEYDLFVNAWMPLPEPYRESEESHD